MFKNTLITTVQALIDSSKFSFPPTIKHIIWVKNNALAQVALFTDLSLSGLKLIYEFIKSFISNHKGLRHNSNFWIIWIPSPIRIFLPLFQRCLFTVSVQNRTYQGPQKVLYCMSLNLQLLPTTFFFSGWARARVM